MMRKIPWHRLLPQHQRIIAYWILAGLGIAAPWMFGEDISFWTKAEHDCVLSSIYDGDTVRAVCGGEKTKIRFYCLDAPEMQQAPWGRESRDHLRTLVPRRFRLIEHTTDRYGRTVGELMSADDSSINLAMVQAGMAAVYPKYCSERRFFAAQQAAKLAAVGIWSRPGLHQRPWEQRH